MRATDLSFIMTISETTRQSFAEHLSLVNAVSSTLLPQITELGQILSNCLKSGSTIFWCGNGGSAADAQHLAAELVGRFQHDRAPLRSIALTTDSSVLTCVANDYSYDDVFSRQISALGSPGDILVVISTSGNSLNVLNSIRAANNIGLITIALLGMDGGIACKHASRSLIIPSHSTARIQELHILVGHIFCELIEETLGFA